MVDVVGRGACVYRVGVDVGTTSTAAAVERDGVVTAVPLGSRAHVVPSVVLLGEDGTLVVGEEAARRAPLAPARAARHFARDVGERLPLRLGGRRVAAHELVADVVAWVVERVTAHERERPTEVVLAVEASWDADRLAPVVEAARERLDVPLVTVPGPVAAGRLHALRGGMADGDLVAVYDLGGGTTDAAVVRREGDEVVLAGLALGDDQLGGLDVDQLLVDLVARRVGPAWQELDPTIAAAARAVAEVRLAVAEAKEQLSTATETVVPVLLPGEPAREVLVGRAGFEDVVEGLLRPSAELVGRAVAAAGAAGRVTTVLLVGGSARIPLVARLVGGQVAAPVVLDPHPKLTVSLGALVARADGASVRVVEPPPGADATVRFALPPMDDPSVVSPDAQIDLPPAARAEPTVPVDAGPLAEDADPVHPSPPAPEPVVARTPAPDATTDAPVAEAPAPAAPGTCEACGEVNPVESTYCRRCGAPLRDVALSFAPGATEAEADGGRSRRRRRSRTGGVGSRLRSMSRIGAIAGTGVGGVALLALLATRSGLLDRARDVVVDDPFATASAVATPVDDVDVPIRIDPAAITATATSSLAPIGDIRYDPDVVLDGDPGTAWNDGVDGAIGIGERLTFRFASPVELTALEIVNGYDKVDPETGEDRWEQNGRVDQLTIATDAGSGSVDLADTRDPQVVAPPAGATCTVELTIESVHPGEDHLDVAISEVAFDGVPADGSCPT